MKKYAPHLDDRGLTLVELLVAVAILAIVTAPLLHSFFTSAKTTYKSRQLGDATTCAQNIIETIEETPVDSLLTPGGLAGMAGSLGLDLVHDLDADADFYVPDVSDPDGYTPSAAAVRDSNEKYYIGLQGVDAGSSSFDALITLDASNVLNESPVTQYTELIATMQPQGVENPDDRARADFDLACNDPALGVDPASGGSVLNKSLYRTISIDVGIGFLSADGKAAQFPITLTYTYSGGFDYQVDNLSPVLHKSYVWPSATDPGPAPMTVLYGAPIGALDGTLPASEAAFSMYFFFDSFYAIGNGTDETIIIRNFNNEYYGRDLRFNLFLVRQKVAGKPVDDRNTTPGSEATYSALVKQYEPYGLGTEVVGGVTTNINACKVYTNMNTNLLTDGNIPGFAYRVFPSVSNDALWYNPGTAEPKLVVSDILDRMLYVNVKLFPVGEGFAAGKELISMNATKLD